MSSSALGKVAVLTGWIIMALILYFLFAPSQYQLPFLFLPTTVIGVGSIIATLFVVVGLTTSER